MDWTTKQFYSYNGILQALINKKSGIEDNVKLPVFDESRSKKCLVIGGGSSVFNHLEGLKKYLQTASIGVLVFSSSKNAGLFESSPVEKLYCIQGKEADRLEDVLLHQPSGDYKLIYPPFPRQMGTQVPAAMKEHAVELARWQLAGEGEESHLRLALETALLYNPTEIIVAGFDGYNSEPSSIEYEVAKENDLLFEKFRKNSVRIVSLTPTRYKNIDQFSLYSIIR
jgi:4-hydroxy 2-oxovalerate aldolase